tara:strand:+ start:369 stop:590 length:222 start_codon:yes stop_codon:yes gene_type:complete
MKRYISSDKPKLAQTGNFIFITGKSNKLRKPVKTWKRILKEHRKSRTVKVQERAKPIPAELTEWLKGIQSIAE